MLEPPRTLEWYVREVGRLEQALAAAERELAAFKGTPELALAVVVSAQQWNREAADDFRAVYGVDPPAQFFAHVKPVAKLHGWSKTRPVLKQYMEETPLKFLNVAKCLSSRIALGRVREVSPAARRRLNGLNALIQGGLKGDGT